MRRTAALALALALALAGCDLAAPTGPSPAPGPTPSLVPAVSPSPPPAETYLTLPYDPEGTWNPYGGASSNNLPLLGLMAEGLYRLDSSFTPQPVLAQWAEVSENGLVWTFALRTATFSDGTPLNAQFAVQAINAARGERSVYASRLQDIRRVATVDDMTFAITLHTPNAGLRALLDFPLVLVTESGALGTGPYRQEGAWLTPNPFWWKGDALPASRVALAPVETAQALAAAFDSGSVSLIPADLTAQEGDGGRTGCQRWDYPTSSMLFVGYNSKKGACRDGTFRRAISLCLNRSALVADVLGGHGAAAALPLHPAAQGYPAQLAAALDYDPAGAAQALDELGYVLADDGLRARRGTPLILQLAVCGDSGLKTALAQRLAEDLTAAGVGVEVHALSWEKYIETLEKGSFDLYLGESRLSADRDLSAFFLADGAMSYGVSADQGTLAALSAAKGSGYWNDFYLLWAAAPTFGVLGFKSGSVLARWGAVAHATPSQGNLFDGFANWSITP